MEVISLKVKKRESTGTTKSRGERRDGYIPAVVYGKSIGSISVLLEEKGFIHIAQAAKWSQVYVLDSEDKKLNGKKVIIKDLQRDYIKGYVLHIDFQILEDKREVRVKIPVEVVGTPFGVKNEGGVLTVSCYSILLGCDPSNIPSSVSIDVSNLKIGERKRTQDIELPKGSRLRSNPLETVANVLSSRVSKTEEEEVATATEEAPATDAQQANNG